jgi:drug/metabolite transporter (DMT)-like permease
MKYIPSILIVLSFVVICVGAWLKSNNNPLGMPMIIGGLISEALFIGLNRYLMNQRNKT